MTLKLWGPQVVGIYINLLKYHGGQWWNILTEAGTDGRADIIHMDWCYQHPLCDTKIRQSLLIDAPYNLLLQENYWPTIVGALNKTGLTLTEAYQGTLFHWITLIPKISTLTSFKRSGTTELPCNHVMIQDIYGRRLAFKYLSEYIMWWKDYNL